MNSEQKESKPDSTENLILYSTIFNNYNDDDDNQNIKKEEGTHFLFIHWQASFCNVDYIYSLTE